MTMDRTGSSIRFFIAALVGIGMLMAALAIYDHNTEQAFAYMKDFMRICFIIALIVLLLSWLAMLRIARSAQEELAALNRNLEEKVKERTLRLAKALEELQKAQSQLLQSEKFSAVGQLAAGIAHEINNPIGFINSNLQTLEKYFVHYKQLLGFLNQLEEALRNKDKERAAQVVSSWEKTRTKANFTFMDGDIGNLLKESKEGTAKITKIVADLCTLTSPDQGAMDPVNLEALMESMLNITWNELKYKAQLKKDYSEVPPVVCNPQKIGQVFVNLLTNAVQAIKEKGFITVKTYAQDGYACVDVSDTGSGIDPQNMTRLFDPFFTTKPVGRGLGLSISYDIVRRHGGTIKCHSRADEGTTFTVMLPTGGGHERN